ncbi:hypothetical protein Tco_0437920 [Tanacetum coccineum]
MSSTLELETRGVDQASQHDVKSLSYDSHEHHLELYNALMNSMAIDEMEQEYSYWFTQQKKKNKVDDDNTPEYTWLNDFVDATKDLEEDKIQEGSMIMFAKKLKEILKKKKLTKADLRGARFELLKSRFSNSIELEYNME